KAYQEDKTVTVSKPGETWQLGGYTFRYDNLEVTGNDNRDMFTAKVTLLRDGQQLAEMHPARWHYTTGTQETTSEVDIDRSMFKDVYIVLNGFEQATKQANFTVFLNPLVCFVWLGFGIMAIGAAVCLFPAALLGFAGRGAAGAAVLLVMLTGGQARADTTP